MYKVVFSLLVMVGCMYGAACASNAAGNWSDAGTWTTCGGGVPGNGDTATITHAVVVTANAIIGTSDVAGTVALTITSPGTLTVNSGITFTFRGDILQNNGSINMQAGSTLNHDSSLAVSPSTTSYVIRPNNFYQTGNQFNAGDGTGVNTSRVTVRSENASSAANGRFSLNGFLGYTTNIYRTDFVRFGDASNRGALCSNATSANLVCRMEDVTFTDSGGVSVGNPATNTNNVIISFRKIRFSGTVPASCGDWVITNAIGTGTGNTRELYDIFCDKNLTGGTSSFREVTISYTVSLGFLVGLSRHTAYDYNIAYSTVDTVMNLQGTASNSYFYSNSGTNPKVFQFQTSSTDNFLVDSCIAQSSSSATEGDMFIQSNTGNSARTFTVQNTLILPRTGDFEPSGTLLTNTITTSAPSYLYNNTWVIGSGSNHGVQYNETGQAPVGLVSAYRSNIGWAASVVAGENHFNPLACCAILDNTLLPENTTNNTMYNGSLTSRVGKTSDNTYYDVPTTVTVPGANDLNENPNFPGIGRNLESFGLLYFGSGVAGTILTSIGTDPVRYIPLLLDYLRTGFMPQNPRIWISGYNGTYGGAVNPHRIRYGAGLMTGVI